MFVYVFGFVCWCVPCVCMLVLVCVDVCCVFGLMCWCVLCGLHVGMCVWVGVFECVDLCVSVCWCIVVFYLPSKQR